MRHRAEVRARLSWRLLLVPRLVLVPGVILLGLVKVCLARRRPQPPRLSPTSDDPVAEVLAAARPAPRFAGEDLSVADLRWIVSVNEVAPADEDGYNTVVDLADEVAAYADVAADGLADALADQPGVDAVDQADRAVVLVRSALALPDVQAAAIRALLAVNRSPRRTPRRRSLRPAMMSAVADEVATILGDRGFVGRLRTDPDHDEPRLGQHNPPGPGFYRSFAEERLVQVVWLLGGLGDHHDDGTVVNAQLRITVEVIEIATTDVPAAMVLKGGGEVIAGENILSDCYDWMPATVDGIEQVLVTDVLPLCESTTSRAAIVDRWVGGLPWYVPDRPRAEAAGIAARWGFPKHARDLARYGPRPPRVSQGSAGPAGHPRRTGTTPPE